MSADLEFRINHDRPIPAGTIGIMEYQRPLGNRRFISGNIDGGYLSASVETKGPNKYTVRGLLRGAHIDFHVTTGRHYLDISTAVPGLEHGTAEAIWRLVTAEMKLPLK
ncbi:MAG: hypothetical protein ACAI38_19590 [Myxococcota bacterium]|nr:hypothetical protein [Myxococcota bacterium]